MELDPQQLKEKALLLLQRERELFELRMGSDRVAVWLRLAQALPQVFADPQVTIAEAYGRLRKILADSLRFQRVFFFQIEESTLRPLAPAGADRALGAPGLALVTGETVGVVNEPDEAGAAALAEALGLHRFIWSRIEVAGRAPVLLAAGYDRAKAKFYPAIDRSDGDNLRNTVQHIQGLIRNAELVSQVQQERDRLKQAIEMLQARDVELRAMAEELRAANETLEQRVVERTNQLGQRNRDMRLVLDNVPTALVTIDGSGRLASERSAKVDEWLGPYEGTPSFVDYIARVDDKFAEQFALAHEALVSQVLPLDLCIHQLPSRISVQDRIYQCSYRPLSASDDETSLLIVIEDVTEQRRLAQDEAEQRELLAVFQGLMRDRAGVMTFFEEGDRLVREIVAGGDPTVRRRQLHTLKGSAGIVGAKLVADICHRAEDELEIDGSGIDGIMTELQARWSAIRQTFESTGAELGCIEVPAAVLDQLCEEIGRGAIRGGEIQRRLRQLSYEPAERPLARLTQHAKALALRLGKPSPVLTVECDGARLDPRRFGAFWTALVHLVRNAVDHGLEPPEDRTAQGKPAGGRITLRASHTPDELAIEIEDDGRGIDWPRVAELAAARGLPHGCEADLLRAIFADGFSTRSKVSATSGRGVGMSAVEQEVAKLGGTIVVRSAPRLGTCWRVVVPLAPPAAPSVALPRETSVGASSPPAP